MITRIWAMPNKNTFQIQPIFELINRYKTGKVIDPFANTNRIADITNDIDPQYDTDYNIDAIDFLKRFGDNSIDTVLFDPPFSSYQVVEVYRKLNETVNMQTTQGSYWKNLKTEIARILRAGGICISCAWNSNGIGKQNGFKIIEILLVPHGGVHNDTIVTVEKKVVAQKGLYENQ